MTLIKSISGIRGTIGGAPGQNLTPLDIVESTAGYAQWVINQSGGPHTVVIGRDGRISGLMVSQLIIQTLRMTGIQVVDLGLSTTPTVEIAVPLEHADGGIIITASHNPKEWNALKFLNQKGEFISAQDGEHILDFIANRDFPFVQIDRLGPYKQVDHYMDIHIEQILALHHVLADDIRSKSFKVVVDCINSTAALIMPKLFKALNCDFVLINNEIHGHFAHNPEPLPQHLTTLCKAVKVHKADLGVAVDPDVDRLALVDEHGDFIGEEYTIVCIADYLLQNQTGHTVSNMSSSDALRQVTMGHGGSYSSAKVGEVNVVEEMKKTNALFGGEGNGGVIYPPLHYGRDAVVGVALVLSHLVQSDKTLSVLRASYPDLVIIKDKVHITPDTQMDTIIHLLKNHFKDCTLDTRDGIKIILNDAWVHLRKSNTEPILRIYAESDLELKAQKLADQVKKLIRKAHS